MTFSIHFKAEVVKSNPQLSKVVMIIFKTGYNRVPKVLPITGNTADWNEDMERFNGSTKENVELNLRISETHKKYVQLAEDWEAANMEWEPRHLSHHFDNPKNLAVAEKKILTVCQVYDQVINSLKGNNRIRNAVDQSQLPYASQFEYSKRYVTKFVRERYGRDFSSYYFPEIDEEFIQHFSYHIESEGLRNGNGGNYRNKMYSLYHIVNEAQEQQIRGANKLNFRCVREKFKATDFDPKTIPYELLLQIEHLDRSLVSKEEQYHLDLYLFCFYCGGMAPVDAAHLRWSSIDLKTSMMQFQRMKTGRLAKPYFIPKAQAIADKYKDQCFGEYVLPILKENYMDHMQRKRRIAYIEQHVNKTLKRVAKLIGTKEDIKFYSARGTFITRMIDLGVHPIVVAEQSGNSPETIYKHYYKHTKHDEVKQIVLAGL